MCTTQVGPPHCSEIPLEGGGAVCAQDSAHLQLVQSVLEHLQTVCRPTLVRVDLAMVMDNIRAGLCATPTTAEQLHSYVAEVLAYMSTRDSEYSLLAGRYLVYHLHQKTTANWGAAIDLLYHNINPHTGSAAPLIAADTYQVIQTHLPQLQSALDYSRDYHYDYFGYKTLEYAYLLKADGRIVERPQHMLLRVAVGIHHDDIALVLRTYELLSLGYYIHATPTLFNAGTPNGQLASCFLLNMQSDSIDGIYETLKQCALISKSAGGIGLHIHKIRGKGSYIRGSSGFSSGLVPMLQVYNDTARYVDQGGGKRKGSFAVYIEPWHIDIYDFLELKKNHGKEESRARDLFYALWIPDLFMRRVEADEYWSLFCPDQAQGLHSVWGATFEALYTQYEATPGMVRRRVKARDLWFSIVEAQIETGVPYMLYKDSCNRKSNQQNLGTLTGSNLCCEILEYCSPDEIAVCNLASISLPKFCTTARSTLATQTSTHTGYGPAATTATLACTCSTTLGTDLSCPALVHYSHAFDFAALYRVAYHAIVSLNKVIDRNCYPLPQTRVSNMRHRPVGLGVQGLADTFLHLRYPFDGIRARELNRYIFETIYYAAVTASNDLARVDGPYSTFAGSPASQGILQYDLWQQQPAPTLNYKWGLLKAAVVQYGMRNSLLVAPMPTASTSQILGNNECFEAFTSNVYTRRVLAGEFILVNKYLLHDLQELGLWTSEMKNLLAAHRGSVQAIPDLPQDLKELYRTVWELPQRAIIDMAADRGAFIDQSQSLNIHMQVPTKAKVTSMHFYAWKKGLKTGMYYLRTRPAADAIQFTVDVQSAAQTGTTAIAAQTVKGDVGGESTVSSPPSAADKHSTTSIQQVITTDCALATAERVATNASRACDSNPTNSHANDQLKTHVAGHTDTHDKEQIVCNALNKKTYTPVLYNITGRLNMQPTEHTSVAVPALSLAQGPISFVVDRVRHRQDRIDFGLDQVAIVSNSLTPTVAVYTGAPLDDACLMCSG